MNTNTNRFNLRSLVIILALVVLLFAGIRATSAAAQAAIPGDALYPVKTTIEQTRLSMASDAGDRAQMKMAFAEQRLNEINSLINEGRYREIDQAVLAFEADINGAILELETLSRVDPARSARLALEITSALTRYAQNLSSLATSAPDAVKNEVTRALTSTHTASGLDLPDGSTDDNANNENANVNGDDHGNDNLNANNNADDSLNANSNDYGDDNSSANSNSNNTNSSVNNNGDDSINANTNGDDSGSTNTNSSIDDNSNANTNGDDNTNTNSSLDDNSNNNSIDDNGSSGNDNGYDDHGGGNGGKGGG